MLCSSKVISSNRGPYTSYVAGALLPPNAEVTYTFRGGVRYGANATAAMPVDFAKYEALALSLNTSGTVHVVHQGGAYSADNGCHGSYGMDDFLKNEAAQAENNGADVVVFTGAGTVCLQRTRFGRAFGPSGEPPPPGDAVHTPTWDCGEDGPTSHTP